MDHRHWAVLKVILLRPWTKLVLGFWGLSFIAVCVPLSYLDSFRQPIPALPPFDQPGPSILQSADAESFRKSTGDSLSNVRSFDSSALPDAAVFRNGQWQRESEQAVTTGQLPALKQLTGLRSLQIQPYHVINAEGWEQIGQLKSLESLWVQNTSAESAEKSQAARVSATRALLHLTKLRQLNVDNAGLEKLPPLPNLEYIVLDAGPTLDQNLRTLSESSPRLREIALRPYAEFDLTSSMRDSLRRMPALRTIWIWSGMKSEADVLIPQLTVLRTQLPDIEVRRGEYSRFRSMALFIFGVTMFWPFLIVTVHRSMMFNAPFAGYFPKYRDPHLFWPYLSSLAMIISFMAICHFFSVSWYAALAIILGGIFMGSEPGIESPRWLAKLLSWGHLAILLLTMSVPIVLGIAPLFAEEFLAGDWPRLAALMIIASVVVIPFRVIESTRAYRLYAELNTPIIPGLTLNAQQLAVAPGDNLPLVRGLVRRREDWIDRRLQQSRSKDFTGRLMALSGSHWVYGLVFLSLLIPHFVMPSQLQGSSGALSVMLFQVPIVCLMLTGVTWRARSRQFSAEFLFPVSRDQFWRSIQTALLKEMLPVVLITIAGVFLLVALETNDRPVHWVVLVPVVFFNGIGLLASFHALTLWVCVSSRSWLAGTLSTMASCLVVALVAPTVPLVMKGPDSTPIVILLTALVVVSGLLAQFLVRRRLSNCELGLIS